MRVNDDFHCRAIVRAAEQRWMRLPCGDAAVFTAGPVGATLYLKTGHLAVPIR